MPHQETAFRRDQVVYWEFSSVDRFNEPLVLPAVELKVRWDDRKTVMRDPQGNPVDCDAQVVAAQTLVPLSVVVHDTLANFVGTGSDAEVLDLYQVVAMDRTPDIKNRASAYVVGLKRYKNELPEIAT